MPTGIDYLNLIAATHQQQLATTINYNSLQTPTTTAQPPVIDLTEQQPQIPGQLDLTHLPELATTELGGAPV